MIDRTLFSSEALLENRGEGRYGWSFEYRSPGAYQLTVASAVSPACGFRIRRDSCWEA